MYLFKNMVVWGPIGGGEGKTTITPAIHVAQTATGSSVSRSSAKPDEPAPSCENGSTSSISTKEGPSNA